MLGGFWWGMYVWVIGLNWVEGSWGWKWILLGFRIGGVVGKVCIECRGVVGLVLLLLFWLFCFDFILLVKGFVWGWGGKLRLKWVFLWGIKLIVGVGVVFIGCWVVFVFLLYLFGLCLRLIIFVFNNFIFWFICLFFLFLMVIFCLKFFVVFWIICFKILYLSLVGSVLGFLVSFLSLRFSIL